MSKTKRELDAEIRAAVAAGHGDTTTAGATRCNTCMRPLAAPFRRSDASGKITEGCVDAAHTGHLYGASLTWHNRPAARALRKAAVDRLRELGRR